MSAPVLLRVRYARWLPVLFTLCAIVNLAACLATRTWMQGLLSVLTGAIGVAYAVNPMLELTGRELRIKNAWGITIKKLPLRALGDIRREGKVLRILSEGRRVTFTARLAHAADLAALDGLVGDAAA